MPISQNNSSAEDIWGIQQRRGTKDRHFFLVCTFQEELVTSCKGKATLHLVNRGLNFSCDLYLVPPGTCSLTLPFILQTMALSLALFLLHTPQFLLSWTLRTKQTPLTRPPPQLSTRARSRPKPNNASSVLALWKMPQIQIFLMTCLLFNRETGGLFWKCHWYRRPNL